MINFIIRNDDIGVDTSLRKLKKFCDICDKYGYKIIQCITPLGIGGKFARSNLTNEQIRLLSLQKFEENKRVLDYLKSRNDFIAVHGLWHTHSPSEAEINLAKQILIGLGLNPTYFVPPFNEGDYPKTIAGLTVSQLSMEKGERLEDFLHSGTPTSPIMYLHYWRFDRNYSFEDLDKCLERLSKQESPDDLAIKENTDYYTNQQNVESYTKAAQEGLWEIEKTLIDKFAPKPPAKILDIGCGAGRTSWGLKQMGYEVTAIDLSAPLIEAAKRNYPDIDFGVGDATKLEFPDNTYDMVLFSFNGIDGLFPVAKRLTAISEIRRVLKSGGVFVMSTHNLIGHIFGKNSDEEIIRTTKAQENNPHLYSWYARYDAHGGPQNLFSAPPFITSNQLMSKGFTIVDIRGNSETSKEKMFWHEPHIYFTARKN